MCVCVSFVPSLFPFPSPFQIIHGLTSLCG
jgi:hypothetical protein